VAAAGPPIIDRGLIGTYKDGIGFVIPYDLIDILLLAYKVEFFECRLFESVFTR